MLANVYKLAAVGQPASDVKLVNLENKQAVQLIDFQR